MNDNNELVVDLGNATEETKGYSFDHVQEMVPLDKKYDSH